MVHKAYTIYYLALYTSADLPYTIVFSFRNMYLWPDCACSYFLLFFRTKSIMTFSYLLAAQGQSSSSKMD